MRRLLALLLTAVGMSTALLAGAASAGAATAYPAPTSAEGRVDPATVHVGEYTIFSGGGFAPNTPLTITDTRSGATLTTTSDASGNFSIRVDFPLSAALGAHELTATGVGANGASREVYATVRVIGVSEVRGTQGSGLPFTGADLIAPLLLGLALVALGVVLVRRGRRSRAA